METTIVCYCVKLLYTASVLLVQALFWLLSLPKIQLTTYSSSTSMFYLVQKPYQRHRFCIWLPQCPYQKFCTLANYTYSADSSMKWHNNYRCFQKQVSQSWRGEQQEVCNGGHHICCGAMTPAKILRSISCNGCLTLVNNSDRQLNFHLPFNLYQS